jgi:hypothetical protein
MFREERRHLDSEKEKIEEQIQGYEQSIRSADKKIFRFLDQAGMETDEVAEARKSPLKRFPGDYDED